MLRSIFQKVQIVKTGFFYRQMFWGKIASLICIGLTALMISSTPAWAFDSSFPDNTVYVINEFESGFHGTDPSGGWGSNDQLFVLKGSILFMADGTFTATSTTDDGLKRVIGADGQGGNTFTTTRTQEPGSASGTYSITPDGVVTITFTFEGEDPDVMTGVLSADGQTVIFGYSEYNESEKHASCGISVGVKKGSGFSSAFPDNTTYVINEFESGFSGGTPGAWGANDELYIVKASFTFMADGTFAGTYSNDDKLNRFIDDDGQGGNIFTTTFTADSGSLDGTYRISSDGVITITFAGGDSDIITGVLSADGQTVILGYSEYDDSQSEASFGIGVGVKKGSGFSSVFPDNTTYLINEFESGFHGGTPGAWGFIDQLFVVKESITFKADGTFTATTITDDGLRRFIGDDGQGGNTFTTTITHEPDSGSGTYSVTSDGVVTVNFDGEDDDEITGVLSANGQTIIFGYSEYDDSQSYASLGIGFGVKRAATQKPILTPIFLLLGE
jgi:hypothetical protein